MKIDTIIIDGKEYDNLALKILIGNYITPELKDENGDIIRNASLSSGVNITMTPYTDSLETNENIIMIIGTNPNDDELLCISKIEEAIKELAIKKELI